MNDAERYLQLKAYIVGISSGLRNGLSMCDGVIQSDMIVAKIQILDDVLRIIDGLDNDIWASETLAKILAERGVI